MTDSILNIWSSSLDRTSDHYSKYSPQFLPPSPKLQQAWSPRINSKDCPRGDLLAQARVLAIFRSGRFPNKVQTSSGPFDDLEADVLNEHALDLYDHDGEDIHINGIQPDFHDDSLEADELSSSLGSVSSSRSTPVQDFIPHWYPLLQSIFSCRSEEDSIHACRTLALSREWKYEDLGELAHTWVSSILRQVPPYVIARSAVNLERILLDDCKHEAASYFVSCISQSAFAAWHHYWNPVMSFSIYPGRPFLVTEKHLDAGYSFGRLVGCLFKSNIITFASVRDIIDLTLENAILLEHIDMIGHLISHAAPELWNNSSENEKDGFVIELYDVLERICEYHPLRVELMEEYEKKVEEICKMVMKS